MLTSSWWVQSCWSHSLLIHSSKLGSFPVQLTSSKWMEPDPTPKRVEWVTFTPSESRVSPNLCCWKIKPTKRNVFITIINTKINVQLKVWVRILKITCTQAVGTPPECLSVSNRHHTLFPTHRGKRFLDVLHGSLHPPPISQYHLKWRERQEELDHKIWGLWSNYVHIVTLKRVSAL